MHVFSPEESNVHPKPLGSIHLVITQRGGRGGLGYLEGLTNVKGEGVNNGRFICLITPLGHFDPLITGYNIFLDK